MSSKIIFFTGKMGAGKTTLAKEMSNNKSSFYLSEDDILSSLFPNEIQSLDDYVEYSKKIKPLVKNLVYDLLAKGLTVVMDFPGNTVRQRTWFKELLSFCNVDHELIYIKATNELCLTQIKKRRNEHPKRHQFDTKELFQKVTSYFQEPHKDEGFHIRVIERKL